MSEPLTFTSPLPAPDCIQGLEKLAEKRHFHFSSGSFIVHIKIDSIETYRDSFNLYVVGAPVRFRLPAFVFFKLIGQIHPSEKGTTIQLRLQLSKPFSKFYWGFLVFSLLISALAFFGIAIAILSSNLWEGLLIGVVVGVTGAGYAWRLYQTYMVGAAKIRELVYQALQQDSPEKPQEQDAKPSKWVSTLSDTR